MNQRQLEKLFDEAINQARHDYNQWLKLMRFCGRNYKYEITDQVLIFAQKPDALAVATYEDWCNKLGRRIIAREKAISLLNTSSINGYTAMHFDVSQTWSEGNKPVLLWSAKGYEDAILRSLNVKAEDFTKGINHFVFNIIRKSGYANELAEQYHEQAGLFSVAEGDATTMASNLLVAGSLTAIHERLGLQQEIPSIKEQFEVFSDPEVLISLSGFASKISSAVLRTIERSISDERKTRRERSLLRGDSGAEIATGVGTGSRSDAEPSYEPKQPVERAGIHAGDDARQHPGTDTYGSAEGTAKRDRRRRVDSDRVQQNVPDLHHGVQTSLFQSPAAPERPSNPAPEDRPRVFGEGRTAGGEPSEAPAERSTGSEPDPTLRSLEKEHPSPSDGDSTGPNVGELPAPGIQSESHGRIAAESEQPSAAFVSRNYRIVNASPSSFGAKARYADNIAAIQTLYKIEGEKRSATLEEQDVLVKYVGWGGIPQAFDKENQSWQEEYKQLRELLDEQEYVQARASTNNAHYTSPVVIQSIYNALQGFGFKGGNVLEPSMGIGNFFGCLPDEIANNSSLYGVELDSITGRIAKQLYPQANIQITGFEDTVFPDNFFDVAISNVPFGSYMLQDNRYDKYHFLIHDYFFAKALDKARPGGIVAFITSKGTLDKANEAVRKYISQRADLIGAIRLPNTAFKSTANTEVTSDILFLKKRDKVNHEEPAWIGLGFTDENIPVNQYFVEHPQMMLGKMVYDSSMYGDEALTALHPFEDMSLTDLLDVAVDTLPKDIYVAGEAYVAENADTLPADPSVQNYTFTLVDEEIYYRQNSLMNKVPLIGAKRERFLGMYRINVALSNVMEMQTEGCTDEQLEQAQGKLNQLYDGFIKKYGRINDRANFNLYREDARVFLLSSLEMRDEEGNYSKADIFTKRTIKPLQTVESVDNAKDALTLSVNNLGRVDFGYMAGIYPKQPDEIITELGDEIFIDPVKYDPEQPLRGWVTASEYLSGNVRAKLTIAKAQANQELFGKNVAALEKNQPEWISAGDIDVRLGSSWVDAKYFNQFMYETLKTPLWLRGDGNRDISVTYNIFNSTWTVQNKFTDKSPTTTKILGTSRINAYQIIEDSLNLKNVVVKDAVPYTTPAGNESVKYVYNHKESTVARQKQEELRQLFKQWIFAETKRRNDLVEKYNHQFNCIVHRHYDGSTLTLPGLNPKIHLRSHQLNGVARIASGNNSLLAHVVGAGKTYTMISGAKEQLRLGIANKVAFVVPNHMIQQFALDITKMYSDTRVIVSRKEDFLTENRKRFLSRIALSDVEMIVIGHSQFEKLMMSPEYVKSQINEDIEEISNALEQVKAERGERYSVKQLEQMKKSLQTQIKKLTDDSKKDQLLTFEQLGINSLFVDEAHYYKNCAVFSKMRNVAGISNAQAKKSSDMLLKTKYLNEIGGCVTFATGTPVSNSMVEVYVMQRYLQNDQLLSAGIRHFDEWASIFGETKTSLELAPEGNGYRLRTRFAKFHNLPELMQMFREVADIQTADMLNLPTPRIATGKPSLVVSQPSYELECFMKDAIDRVNAIRDRAVPPTVDNMLKFTGDAKRAGLDMRLLDEDAAFDPGGKIAKCAEMIHKHYVATQEQRGAQLIFCDTSTPGGKGFNVYNALKSLLMDTYQIPETEIAFIHEAENDTQKEELFAKVRGGDTRILIGSTQKCGAGTNIQKRLIALHHLDCPYRPSDIEQREGRILRQGNDFDEVSIYRYVTERSFDAYLWNIVETKQRFISQIMTGKAVARSCEDLDEAVLSYAEAQAVASGNPLIKEKIEIDSEVSRLQLLKSQHLNQLYQMQDDLVNVYPKQKAACERLIDKIGKDIEMRDKNKTEEFQIAIQRAVYDNRAKAGELLLALAKTCPQGGELPVGSYQGFHIHFRQLSTFSEIKLVIKGAHEYVIDFNDGSGIGSILRLENEISGLDKKLVNEHHRLEQCAEAIQAAEEGANKPFILEGELASAIARQQELNVLLDMDMPQEDEAVDEDMPEQPEPKDAEEFEDDWSDER